MSVTEQAFSRRFPPRPSDPVHEVHDVHDVHEVHETTDPADPVQEPAEMADLLGVNATAYRKDLEKYKEVIGMSQSKRKEAIDWLKRAIQKNEGETRVLEKELGGKKRKIQPNGDGIHGLQKQLAAKRQNKTTLLNRLGRLEGLEAAIRH